MNNINIKKIELDMLVVMQGICKKNNIDFFLIGGSLLGAIRHKGFIPWDDDIDIGMTRKNYEKFIKVANKELNGSLTLETFEIDNNYPLSFAKILDTKYNVSEDRIKNKKSKTGIFIDIFPFDKMPSSFLLRKLQTVKFKLINSYLEYSLGWRDKSFKNKVIFLFFNGPFIKHNLVYWARKRKIVMERYNKRDDFDYYNIASQYGPDREKITNLELKEIKKTQFENISVPILTKYDSILTRQYGDYMKLPSKSERKSKHIVLH